MKTFNLTIRTPEKQVYSGPAIYLKLFTEAGLLKLFPGHADLTGVVTFSPVIFENDHGQEEIYIAKRGLLRVDCQRNSIDLMVLDCQLKAEMNHASSLEYLQFIEKELAQKHDLSDFKIRYMEEEKVMIEKQIKHLS